MSWLSYTIDSLARLPGAFVLVRVETRWAIAGPDVPRAEIEQEPLGEGDPDRDGR